MSQPQRLVGQFISLRAITSNDAAMTLRWRAASRARYLNTGATTQQEQADWIAARPTTEYNFIIELAGSTPVGMIALTHIDPINRNAIPGRFLIGEEKVVRGVPVAAEAISMVYALAFDELAMHRIHGTVAEDNHLMIKWQKYIGMREEGRLRDHYFINGRFQDAVCLGLLEVEYREMVIPRLRALMRLGRHR